MALSAYTSVPSIAERSEATPGLWNNIFGILDRNAQQVRSDVSPYLNVPLSTNSLYAESGTTTRILNGYSLIGRSLDSGGQVYNVVGFGAIGDGVESRATANVTAINAAIDAAYAAGGGVVVIPSATSVYKVIAGQAASANNVSLRSNVALIIEPGAVLQAIGSTLSSYQVVRVHSCQSVFIGGGGAILGERANHTVLSGNSGEWGMCLEIKGTDRCVVRDLTLANGWGDGIYVGIGGGSTCRDVWIENCRTVNNRRNNISVVACDGGGVSNCYVEDANGTAPEAGIDIEPNAYGEVDGFVVANNWVSGNSGHGILGLLFEHCRFANNHIEGNFGSGMLLYRAQYGTITGNVARMNRGIGIRVESDVTNINTKYFTITGNVSSNNSSAGFYLNAGSTNELAVIAMDGNVADSNESSGYAFRHCNLVNVRGNISSNNSHHGFEIFGSGDTGRYCAFSGNILHNNGSRGMSVTSFEICDFSGNVVRNNDEEGMRFRGIDDCTINGNLLDANGKATDDTYDQLVLTNDADRNSIQGNIIRRGGNAARPKRAVNIETSNCNDNVFTNNYTQAGQTGNVLDGGTSTVTLAATGNTLIA